MFSDHEEIRMKKDWQGFIEEAGELARKIDLPCEAFETVKQTAEAVYSRPEAYEKAEKIDLELQAGGHAEMKNAAGLGALIGKTAGETALFLCFCHAQATKERYIRRELPMEVYDASMRDIMIWAKTYHRHYGSWGLEEYFWLEWSFQLRLFRIGRLQYQPGEYTGPECTAAGVTLRPGDPVYWIHIPEDGDFSREARISSYREAYRFFGQTGPAVFACESYLLYEKHREFLWEGSNILSFMDDFHLVESMETAGDNGDLWRIFGWPKCGYADAEHLPRDTRLQRAYADWIAAHHTTGGGTGVMIFDGKEIL